jgi:hypothetical protein
MLVVMVDSVGALQATIECVQRFQPVEIIPSSDKPIPYLLRGAVVCGYKQFEWVAPEFYRRSESGISSANHRSDGHSVLEGEHIG